VQVPLLSHPDAPQVASLIEQSELQQFPVPAMPHWSEAHCEFDVQGEPGGKPLVPPVVVVPVVPAVLPPVVVVAVVPVVPPVVVPPSVEGDELQAARKPPNPNATTDDVSARMRNPFRVRRSIGTTPQSHFDAVRSTRTSEQWPTVATALTATRAPHLGIGRRIPWAGSRAN
jgi:hypothetical protein